MLTKFLPYLKAHCRQVALAQVFVIAAFELLKPWPLQIVLDHVLSSKAPPVGSTIGDLLLLPSCHCCCSPASGLCWWILAPVP